MLLSVLASYCLGVGDRHEMLKLETRLRRSNPETEAFPAETETRHCYFSRRDQDIEVHVVLIAIVQFFLFFAFITS